MSSLDDIRKRVEGLRDLADMPISMLGITGDTKAQIGADIAEAALRIATEQEAELAEAVGFLREEHLELVSIMYSEFSEHHDSDDCAICAFLARQEAK